MGTIIILAIVAVCAMSVKAEKQRIVHTTMRTDYPQEFVDFVEDMYGLEAIDYINNGCFEEWQEQNK